MEILTHAELEALDLTDDQLSGFACIGCGSWDGAMVPIMTPGNPRSTMVFQHAACVSVVAS